MKLFKKTALAVALAAAASAPAFADPDGGDLIFTGGAATKSTVVLADVIFGNGKPGTGSEETLITAPSVTYDLTIGGTEAGDVGDDSDTATIKFTLGGGAVFGEDLSTTALVESANGGSGAFSITGLVDASVAPGGANDFTTTTGASNDPLDPGASAVTYQVVQGGAIGDNTITFELTFSATGPAANAVEDVTFEGYAVKNLTSALNPDSDEKIVELGVEYVESGDDSDADAIDETATDDPLVIFGSQAPVDLVAQAIDFSGTVRINVGNGEKTFTDDNGNAIATPVNGLADFDEAGDTDTISLGTLTLNLEDVNDTAFPTAPAGKVKKENGDNFDFQGGDKHTLTFSVASGELQIGSSVFLSDDSCATSAFDATGTEITDANKNSFSVVVSGNTDKLTEVYDVCYVVNGDDAIPEVGQISATWAIDFFNARYDNVVETAGLYGDLLRNGCIASFFNVPASGNADTAYIRLTNTSTTNEGDIRGTLYAQDGTILGEDIAVAPELAVHATQIFSTEGEDRTTDAGQEVIDIETAFGVDGADYKGRARLVLKGAFDTCEGQGLIRTGGGSLFNMTSTTQGNEAADPDDGNNGN